MSMNRNTRKLYLTEGHSIECTEYCAEYKEGSISKSSNHLRFILRDRNNRIVREFRHESGMNNTVIGLPMIELPNSLLAIAIEGAHSRSWNSSGYCILIFNTQEGKLVKKISGAITGHNYIRGMTAVENSICVAMERNIHVLDLESGKQVSTIDVGGTDEIFSMDSLADSRVIISQSTWISSHWQICDIREKTLKEIDFDGYSPRRVRPLSDRPHIAILYDTRTAEYETIQQIRIYNTNDNSHSLTVPPKSSAKNTSAMEIHCLPNHNLAVAYREDVSHNFTDFVIYPPEGINPIEHLESVNMPFFDDSSQIAYLEHLDWTRLIALHNTLQSHETLPAPLINLIVEYASFAHTPAQARAGITNPSEWIERESRLVFASDKEQKYQPVVTPQETVKITLVEEKKSDKHPPVDPSKKQLLAFTKIYQALYDGETTVWKGANFLADKKQFSDDQLIKAINHKTNNNPRGRTARAWQLALKYYENNLAQNETLFTEIYKQSFSNSGLFKRSTVTGITFFSGASFNKKVKLISKDKIAQHENDNTRTSKIYRALK